MNKWIKMRYLDKNNEKEDTDAEMILKSLDRDIPIEIPEQVQNKESNKFLGNSEILFL